MHDRPATTKIRIEIENMTTPSFRKKMKMKNVKRELGPSWDLTINITLNSNFLF